MSRPRTKPIKPTERDATGVVIPVSAFDSLMANDAAWRALLRLPVGWYLVRMSDGWQVFNDLDEMVFDDASAANAIQEAVGYDE